MKFRIGALLLALCLLCSCLFFYGCSKKTGEIHQTFCVDYGMCQYGNYIYFKNDGTYRIPQLAETTCKLARYNVKTGKISAACMDATCDHTEDSGCPFAKFSTLYYIGDDTIYYLWLNSRVGTAGNKIMAYDISHKKSSVVMDLEVFDCTDRPYIFLGNKVYLVQKILKEGEEHGSADHYTYYMCCADYGADSPTPLFEINVTYHQEPFGMNPVYDEAGNLIGEQQYYDISPTELLHVANNRIYFRDGESGNLYTTDMSGGDVRYLTDFEEFTFLGNLTVHENNLFFVTCGDSDSYEYTYPSPDGSEMLRDTACYTKLYRFDMESETLTKLTDNASDYTVANGKVYYYPWGYRFYGYKGGSEDPVAIRNYCAGKLYSINPDGTDNKLLYSDESTLFFHYIVSGNKALCMVSEYSSEGDNGIHWAVLNLKTGKLDYLE